jgi:HlyD family secretion protein
VRVLVDLTTPQRQWRSLGDGYRVGVKIVSLAVDDVVRVPVSAVFPLPAEEGGTAVFVLDRGRAKMVPVDIAARNGELAWVRKGLDTGARVIVYPPATVRDGERVRERRAP